MGCRAVTHCPRLPHSPGTAIELQHTGAQKNRYSGLPAVLQLCANSCTNCHQKQNGKACQRDTSKRQMNSAGRTKPGEQAHSTLSAALVAPVSHMFSKGLSHRVKGRITAAGTHNPCLNCRASKGTAQMLPIPGRHS